MRVYNIYKNILATSFGFSTAHSQAPLPRKSRTDIQRGSRTPGQPKLVVVIFHKIQWKFRCFVWTYQIWTVPFLLKGISSSIIPEVQALSYLVLHFGLNLSAPPGHHQQTTHPQFRRSTSPDSRQSNTSGPHLSPALAIYKGQSQTKHLERRECCFRKTEKKKLFVNNSQWARCQKAANDSIEIANIGSAVQCAPVQPSFILCAN
jgi:hypothetical protein